MSPLLKSIESHPLSRDIITDSSLKLNTSKVKNDYNALIIFKNVYFHLIKLYQSSCYKTYSNNELSLHFFIDNYKKDTSIFEVTSFSFY